MRSTAGIDLCGAIIVCDEAHNLPHFARQCGSAVLTVQELIQAHQLAVSDDTPPCPALQHALEHGLGLVRRVSQLPLRREGQSCDTAVYVQESGIGAGIGRVQDELAAMTASPQEELLRKTATLPTLTRVVGLVGVWTWVVAHMDSYVVRVIPEQGRTHALSLHCVNASLPVQCLRAARTVIAASGTMPRTAVFSQELGMAFPHSMHGTGIVARGDVWFQTVGECPRGYALRCTAANFPAVVPGIAAVVAAALRRLPLGCGCLLFVPSYRVCSMLAEELGRALEQAACDLICEPRNTAKHKAAASSFNTPHPGRRRLLLAVHRGKVSEGVQFDAAAAVALVVSVGVPYADMGDHRLVNLRRHMQRPHSQRGWQEWYSADAYQAVFQCLGRCLRRRGQKGALLLVDARYESGQYLAHAPVWLRQHITTQHVRSQHGWTPALHSLQQHFA